MAQGSPQRQLHGYVSREAFEAWHSFAESFDVNVTALMEAIADVLGDARDKSERDLPPMLRRVVADARVVAARRSTRRRGEG